MLAHVVVALMPLLLNLCNTSVTHVTASIKNETSSTFSRHPPKMEIDAKSASEDLECTLIFSKYQALLQTNYTIIIVYLGNTPYPNISFLFDTLTYAVFC